MKIAFTGLVMPEGKMKYDDNLFVALVEKFQPKKVSPHYFEFLAEDYEAADVIAIARDNLLDLLILDMEKIEVRMDRVEDAAEKDVLTKCLAQLEDQRPVCDMDFNESEHAIINAFNLLSFTPTLVCDDSSIDPNVVCRDGMDKAGMMFFYTVGKQEVHAWLVEKGADAVTCAGKIHTDLARGFIKAEIVSCADMMTVHNLQDARSKGLTDLVDRGDIIAPESILDIRFNV